MKTYIKLMKILIVPIIVLSILANQNIIAQIPSNLQAALFKKILSMNLTLKAKGDLKVAVLTGDGNGDDIVSAFNSVGIAANAVSGNQPPGGASVVYVMPGVTAPTSECASNGVLSISGDGSYAESGKVAIGIGTVGGKPKIIINFAQLKAEGQEVSASLLTIAKVIK